MKAALYKATRPGLLADSERGWFCSEALAAALGWAEPWRFGPNGLSALLRSILKGE